VMDPLAPVAGSLMDSAHNFAVIPGPTRRQGDAREHHIVTDRPSFTAIRPVLDETPWRYRLGSFPTIVYAYDDGWEIHLHKGIPAAPLPRWSVGRLQRALFDRDVHSVHAPGAAAHAFAAIQALRPSWNRGGWQRHLDDGSSDLPQEGSRKRHFDARGLVWGAGTVAARRLRRGRRLLAGTPAAGTDHALVRFSGLRLEAGPGIFLPVNISEGAVEAILETVAKVEAPVIVEVGTGCGAVAIALARSRPDASVHASDLSSEAIHWATRNGSAAGVHSITWHVGSLLQPFPETLVGTVDAMTVNVPYVPGSFRHAGWDDMPGSVQGTGSDGLGLQRELLPRAAAFLRPGGTLVVQMTADQWGSFPEALHDAGFVPGEIYRRSGADVIATARR